MQKVSDIYELARLFALNGNPPKFSRGNLPAYQESIARVLPTATNSLVDELGFVADKDCWRCYLSKPIDFQWLSDNIILEAPLHAAPELNRVFGEWIEIMGGT